MGKPPMGNAQMYRRCVVRGVDWVVGERFLSRRAALNFERLRCWTFSCDSGGLGAADYGRSNEVTRALPNKALHGNSEVVEQDPPKFKRLPTSCSGS